MDEAEAKLTHPDVISYMATPASVFENVLTWASIAIANSWTHTVWYCNQPIIGLYTKGRLYV